MKYSAPTDMVAGILKENIRRLKLFEGRSVVSRTLTGTGKVSLNNPDSTIRINYGSQDSRIVQCVIRVWSGGFTATVNGREHDFTVQDQRVRKTFRESHPAIRHS